MPFAQIKKAPTSGAFQSRTGISYGAFEDFSCCLGGLSPRTLGTRAGPVRECADFMGTHRLSALGITRFALPKKSDLQTKVFLIVNDVARLVHGAPESIT